MDEELLELACAVLREHCGGAFTTAERRLVEAIVLRTGLPWPECLGKPQEWELPQTPLL